MRASFHVTATACAIAAIVAVAPAGADTIVIQSGALAIPALGTSVPKPVSLSGDRRGFTLDAVGVEGPFGLRLCPDMCGPGRTVSADALFVGLDLRGAVTLDGTTYPVGSLESASALLQFTSSMVLPAAGDAAAVVTAPFLFEGLFTAFGGTPVDLLGRGTVRTTFAPALLFGEFRWMPEHTLYQFEDPLDPIPEPGTLGLLAVAGAFALRRGLRRRRAAG